MSKSKHRSPFIQQLITSYFPTTVTQLGFLSLTTELDSLFYTCDGNSEFCYVSETPVSKRGNSDYYLGKCNTVSEETPKRTLFEISAISIDSSGTLNNVPSLSDVNFGVGSPTHSCESVAIRR